MKFLVISLILLSSVLSSDLLAHIPVERHPCELIYTDSGDVLLLLDGHLYEIAAWHSSECSCGIQFEIDDPDD